MDREHKVLNIDPPVPSPRPRPVRLAADDGSSGSFHGEYENATIVVVPTDNAGGGCSSFVLLPANVAASGRAVPGSGIGEELNRPVPAPRRVKGQLYNEGEEGAEGFRGTRYENVIVISQETPIHVAPPLPSAPSYHALSASSPAMPPQPSPSPPPGVSFVKRRDNGSRRVAAAAAATADRRRHSVGPGSLCNMLDGAAGDSSNGMDAGYHREATECELGDDRRNTGDNKYKTSSPDDLFKSTGTTSRMLTESIGERVPHKSRKVAENVRNTSSTIVSWSQETTGKQKSVGRSSTRSSSTSAGGGSSGIDSTTTTCDDDGDRGGGGMAAVGGTADSWSQSAKKERDKPKSEGGMMQNIKFTSPLLDEPSTIITTTIVLPRNTTITTTITSTVNDAEKDKRSRAGADEQPAFSSSGQTYDIPRRGNKPSDLRPAPGSRAGSSSGGGSVHSASESNTTSPVSSASSSNTTTPERWVGGTVCREAQRLPPNFRRLPLARSNLYTTVLPKCQRVEKGKPGLGWIPPPPSPAPLADRHKQHKSESNLHKPTFHVQHPMLLDDGSQLCDRQGRSQNHLYGKLNILPGRAISSSSSSGGGLYTTVLPKCQRVEKGKPGLGWIPPPPPPEPLADRHKQHKSESNLHKPTFHVQHPMLLDDGSQLCDRQGRSQNHLYGKLNILPRRAISSSSSSGGGLYTTVLPKCQRVEKGKPGLGWIPPPPPPEPLADRHKQHKSESNLHKPTFHVQHPMLLDDGSQLCDRQGRSQNHLHGKLNILPRRATSSSSSSGGGGDLATDGTCSCRWSMADSEEDNMFSEGRRLVELGSTVEVQPQTAGGKRQDGQQTEASVVAKYRPLSWNYNVIAHEPTSSSVSPPILVAEVTPATDDNGEQGNCSAATNNLEPYYGNAGGGTQPIYNILAEPQVLSSSRSVLQPVSVDHGGTVNQGQRHDYDSVSFYSDIIEFDPLVDTSEANYSQSSLEPELCFDSSNNNSRELWLIEDMLSSESSVMERTSLTSSSQQQSQAADENVAAGRGGSDQVDRGPQIPERSDLLLPPGMLLPKRLPKMLPKRLPKVVERLPKATVPVKPKRSKLPNSQPKPEEQMKGNNGKNSRSIGHIVHQKLALPADSMENLVEESLVQSYLSVVEEESEASGGSNGGSLDLSYPKRHPRKTCWYV